MRTMALPRFLPDAVAPVLALLTALLLAVGSLGAQANAMRDAAHDAHATAATQVVNADAAGVAIKGYDVVAYQTQGVAVAGTPSHTATYRGATFRFASAANRAAFVAEPARYMPKYGGYCAMGVAVGRKFDIDPTAFKVVDGTLYLNKDAATQRAWQRDIPGNIAKGDAKWAVVATRAVER
jgi:YHS domain-containing protein